MNQVQVAYPSGPLREYIRSYSDRDVVVHGEPVSFPVSAQPDPQLVLSLRDPYIAYEFAHERARLLPSALIVGPQTQRAARIEIRGHYAAITIMFQPGAMYRLFGVSGADLVDRAADAIEALDAGLAPLLRHLQALPCWQERVTAVEAYFLARLKRASSVQPVHRAAWLLHSSNGAAQLPRLIASTGHSVRHFNRAFLTQLGMTPKRYARVTRFSYASRLKLERPELTWTDVSQEAGYFDQNHLVKDFKALGGHAPSAYLSLLAATPGPLRPHAYQT